MPDLDTGLWTISTSTVDVFALSLIAEAVSQSSNSRKNQIYKAFREVGRVMRTVALVRFLADSGLRARVTAATNKPEADTEVLRLDPGSASRA
jgi:TnpA family transposase